MKVLLLYLDYWKNSVNKRKGPFSAAERKQMMLSKVTQNGIRITGMYEVWVAYLYDYACFHSVFFSGTDTNAFPNSWCNLFFDRKT